jgi:hypothetical protein
MNKNQYINDTYETEKLCLLADVMLVSMIILRIMVSKKNMFLTLKEY